MTFEELPQGFKDWKNQYACDDPSSPGYNIRDLYAAYSAGVQAERERCARIAEKKSMTWAGPEYYNACSQIAASIRGQG